MLIGIGQCENSSMLVTHSGDIFEMFSIMSPSSLGLVFILQSPFINPELLEIEKKTCRIASCEMVFESVAARLLHEQEFKESIFVNQTHNFWVIIKDHTQD